MKSFTVVPWLLHHSHLASLLSTLYTCVCKTLQSLCKLHQYRASVCNTAVHAAPTSPFFSDLEAIRMNPGLITTKRSQPSPVIRSLAEMVQRTDRLKSFCVRLALSKMVEEGKSFVFFHFIRYPFSFPPKHLGPFHGPLRPRGPPTAGSPAVPRLQILLLFQEQLSILVLYLNYSGPRFLVKAIKYIHIL